MDIFKKFKDALKIREIYVDNEVFQLHYKITAVLLLGCAALVASKQHFGDPIDCITRDDVPNKIMDTYCWIHATFTLPAACNKTVGYEVPHPCVDKFSGDHEERIYHKYYQWVYFVLFFQSACFYVPHFYWKAYEAHLLSKLAGKFKDPLCKFADDEKRHLKLVVQYLVRNRLGHQSYFYQFIACEIANLVNVILQMYLVDGFLGGMFTSYGLDVLNYVQMNQDDRMDPMVRVFPRMTKCSFHRFGASGDVQKYDALCILPLNIINEKIYIVMWFWFVLITGITSIWLVYRLLTLTQHSIRVRVLARRASLVKYETLEFVLQRIRPGDWFLLSMMCRNMDAQWFRHLMDKLAKELKKVEPIYIDPAKQRSWPANGPKKNCDANDDASTSSGREELLSMA